MNERMENLSIEDDDFGFLVDSEGNLKTIFGADELFDDPPENVVKILAIFGIGLNNISELRNEIQRIKTTGRFVSS